MQQAPTFQILPAQASTIAPHVDYLFWFLVVVTALGAGLVFILVVTFAMRFREDKNPVPTQIEGSTLLEATWTLGMLGLFLIVFVWGALLYFRIYNPPADAMDVYVVGKQWMWKTEHPSGQREINALHVPINRPVRLTLISQDVFHSFSIPAFRVKREAIPGKYNTVWFEATRPGVFSLFCTQYCGTSHSEMIGEVTAMEPAAYEAWLAGGAAGESLAQSGEKLFLSLGCNTCHRGDSGARGPNLAGLYNTKVQLADGRTVIADEAYIRESILNPTAKIVAGFQPIMPTFQGQVSEDGLIQLVEYVKSLSSNAQIRQTINENQVGAPPAHSVTQHAAPGENQPGTPMR